MCNVPPQTCPQDGSIVRGTVSTDCFLQGAGIKQKFKGPQDFANPALMKEVFGVQDGFPYFCSDQRYDLKLPSTTQEALQQSTACVIQVNNDKYDGWKLPKGCVGNNPSGNTLLNVQCCAGDAVYANCPYGYCPNNDGCGNVMSQWCKQNGANDPYCKDYFKNSINDSQKKIVAGDIVSSYVNPQYPQLQNNPFSNIIYNVCKNAPSGGCDEFLYKNCARYTRSDLSADPNLSDLCGCHLPAPEYNKYKDLKVPGGIIQKQCDPLCFDVDTIQEGVNCQDNKCTQAVCIIDFSNENIQKFIQEGAKLDQNCYGSPGKGNDCVFSLNVNGARELKETNINVSQNCGSCKLWDPDNPNMTPASLDCKNLSSSIENYFNNPTPPPKKKINILYVVIGVVVIVVLLMFGLFFYEIFKK